MKLTFFTALFALASLTATSASAQSMSSFAVAKQAEAPVSGGSEAEAAATETPTPSVSARVLSSFNKNFKGTSANWFSLDGNLLARFTKDGRATHALYKKNGYMIYSVTKGSQDLLPASTRQMIYSVYRDYDITSVSEATSLGTTAWITHLKLGHSLIVIKVLENEIVEETRYRISAR